MIDYLVDEVLRRQDAEVRAFLRQTAILDRLSAPLCDAVTERADSRARLGRLERDNLFIIPLDPEHQWYRYHHLFADALHVELDADPQQRALLQQRAAAWLAAHGFVREAIRYALAAQAWHAAGRLIQRAADEALNVSELRVLSGWLDTLPDAVVLADPELALLKGYVAYTTGDAPVGLAAVASLDHVSRDQLSPRSWGRLAGLRAVSALAREAPEAAQLLQEALALIGEDDPLFRQRALMGLAVAPRLAGDTIAAGEAYAEAVRLGRGLPGPSFTIAALHELAFNLIERGRRRDALALCEAGQPFIAPLSLFRR